MSQSPLQNTWAVILCGGRGSRLGSLTDAVPKPLLNVHDKPILWYIFLTLYRQGFRRFIFPIGYKGELIEGFITQEFEGYDCMLRFVETGVDTRIAKRLQIATKIIPDQDNFFLLNGDTIFDFDIEGMYHYHLKKKALVTLTSVEIISPYGIIVEKDGSLFDFSRDRRVSHFSLDHDANIKGYVNAGLSWLNKDSLKLIDLESCENFEQDLYPKVISQGRAAHYKIFGSWFAIDTQKDLHTINLETETKQEIGKIMMEKKKNLASRYSYQTRYLEDIRVIKEKIMNQTIIPHQVEVQPGPDAGPLCWLRCPYCYGQTAKDTKERIPIKRYVEIMKQIADGGVKKIVFAGYATDPLNYRHIEDLHQVTLKYNQVFGFHTKALKVSERFTDQVTNASTSPMSYFSVSVDAGSNKVYNRVHGIPASEAGLYERVCANVRQISEKRNITGAPLDISATYLINGYNNAEDEVVKFIRDFRRAGVDLIRFTFPQVPRGYTAQEGDNNIPSRREVLEYMDRLRTVVENENSESCQVIILDLDGEYLAYRNARTLPCYARFIFPSIGFDGWLSHCSESAAPHFRKMALGNLNQTDFWDLFYNYSVEHFRNYMKKAMQKMELYNCKCDRKEHIVNDCVKQSGIFDDMS